MKIFRIPLVIVLLVVAGRAFNASSQTVTTLYSFGSYTNDGQDPHATLVQGSDGNLYGTTAFGGTNSFGTIYRISSGGSYTSLYSFVGSPHDGAQPEVGLVQGSDGNFYGTTEYGGSTNCLYGCGIVFRISPSGSYTNLHSFSGSDGYEPLGRLVQGSDGSFYGTTYYGGTNSCNCGTVYRISPGGSYTSLYSFVGSPNDGANPVPGLALGSDGNFYGTTVAGGANNTGTVYRISPGGSYTSLYSFVGPPTDGAKPEVRLVQGSDGNFYGTTAYGGTSMNCSSLGCGTVYRISPSGSYTNLYSFSFSGSDGAGPVGRLVQGSDGNFYGTTLYGGTSMNCGFLGCGTVYRISPGGSETDLYPFDGSPNDGANPDAGLVQGSDGNFYGTTYYGGANNTGTVFKLIVPLSPPPYPVNQITSAHIAATNIILAITSIAGETYQLQFSSSMKPTNWVNVGSVSVSNSIGALLTLTNFAGATGPQGFYRFAITP